MRVLSFFSTMLALTVALLNQDGITRTLPSLSFINPMDSQNFGVTMIAAFGLLVMFLWLGFGLLQLAILAMFAPALYDLLITNLPEGTSMLTYIATIAFTLGLGLTMVVPHLPAPTALPTAPQE